MPIRFVVHVLGEQRLLVSLWRCRSVHRLCLLISKKDNCYLSVFFFYFLGIEGIKLTDKWGGWSARCCPGWGRRGLGVGWGWPLQPAAGHRCKNATDHNGQQAHHTGHCGRAVNKFQNLHVTPMGRGGGWGVGRALGPALLPYLVAGAGASQPCLVWANQLAWLWALPLGLAGVPHPALGCL